MEHPGRDETIRLLEGAIRRHDLAVGALSEAVADVRGGGAPALVNADVAVAAALHHGDEARARATRARAMFEPT